MPASTPQASKKRSQLAGRTTNPRQGASAPGTRAPTDDRRLVPAGGSGRGVARVAVDTLSLDHSSSRDFAFHLAWLGAGRWGLECAANLGALPPTGATIVVGAPRIAGGTGGPGRAPTLL